MAANALFILSLTGFGAIFVLSGLAFATGRYAFWPPPEGGRWQKATFRWLFRLAVYPLACLSVWVLLQDGSHWARLAPGLVLMGIGFGGALHITGQLGWGSSFGDAGGLKTQGWFARSRNPVYVATWVGLAGWAWACPDWRVLGLLALWALLYLVAPRLEEPWLRATYGAAYEKYMSQTPRFF